MYFFSLLFFVIFTSIRRHSRRLSHFTFICFYLCQWADENRKKKKIGNTYDRFYHRQCGSFKWVLGKKLKSTYLPKCQMRIIMNYEICILIARNAGHSKPWFIWNFSFVTSEWMPASCDVREKFAVRGNDVDNCWAKSSSICSTLELTNAKKSSKIDNMQLKIYLPLRTYRIHFIRIIFRMSNCYWIFIHFNENPTREE